MLLPFRSANMTGVEGAGELRPGLCRCRPGAILLARGADVPWAHDQRCHMRRSRVATLSAFVAVGAISLPLLASTASAVAASPRTTTSIGTQLAELKGSDTVAGDNFGQAVAISGTTAIVGAV